MSYDLGTILFAMTKLLFVVLMLSFLCAEVAHLLQPKDKEWQDIMTYHNNRRHGN